jgi:hypothetical protein
MEGWQPSSCRAEGRGGASLIWFFVDLGLVVLIIADMVLKPL